MTEFTQRSVPALIGYIEDKLANSIFFQSEEETGAAPLLRTYAMSGTNVPVLLVAGINASGKSILTNMVEILAMDCGFAHRCVSMDNRTSGSGIERAMIFGTESDQSTGYISTGAVIKGLKSSQTGDKPAALILDEPDIGLSEEMAGAMGEYIAQHVLEQNHNLKFIMIVSHSRPMFERVLEKLPYAPHVVFMGSEDMTFDAWLNGPQIRLDPSAIDQLRTKGKDTWRNVEQVISNRKKASA
ncbi:hypothetical protein RYA05_01590 [Pseudomonas syringae pv. actinidiae]|nr:hypothetical protein [Pseudomonas syringae pv. actinidiae]